MRLKEFRVRNYRSILDSGWIEVDDIAVVVGKNESGKTSLLRALSKFKPFKNDPFLIDREWPRGKRKDRSETFEVVTCRFELTEAERTRLASIDPLCAGLTGVEIGKNYKGDWSNYKTLPHDLPRQRDGKYAREQLAKVVSDATSSEPPEVADELQSLLVPLHSAFDDATADAAKSIVEQAKEELTAAAKARERASLAKVVASKCDSLVKALTKSPFQLSWEETLKGIPTFIYMDDWLAFRGTAQLDEVQQRRQSGKMRDDDETIITIMEMAGLSLDEEVEKGKRDDREQRMLDMNDASRTLTDEIASRWSQKKYEVMFQADGQHFVTFVKDDSSSALVPLEERSKGFQWFFSFDMKFMYETDGVFKDAVLLLDEPGLHLHAAAQRDLLKRMREYAKSNQLIYTTHLPFMIDMSRLDNIWVAEESPSEGTRVHKNWAMADKDARFTLQAALGLSWAQTLFVGRRNLVVEGVTDFWFLTAMSSLLSEGGEASIAEGLVITPAGGASKVAYLATLLKGQELHVSAFLDSDKDGFDAQKQLVHNWLLQDDYVLMLGEIVGRVGTVCIEDLFDESYYISHTEAAYSKELNGSSIVLPADPKRSVVERLEVFFQSQGIAFNKGRVAKRIMRDLAAKTAADIAPATLSDFRKVIAAINRVDATWRNGLEAMGAAS